MLKKSLIAALSALLLAGAAQASAPIPKVVSDKDGNMGIERRVSEKQVYSSIFDLRASFQYGSTLHNLYRDVFWIKAQKDYSKLADDFIPEYRKEADAFKREDMLDSLKGKLDEIYKAEQSNEKLVNISFRPQTSVSIESYNPAEKGFRMTSSLSIDTYTVRKEENGNSGVWAVGFLDIQLGQPYKDFYYKPDRESARRIESYLASKRSSPTSLVSVKVQVNGYVVSAQAFDQDRLAVISADSISLLDDNQNVLATVESTDLAPVIQIKGAKLSDKAIKAIKAEYGIKDKEYKGPVVHF
ncbi:hypothetical protein WJ970_33835 [Achromobacter xylosoxidans]